MSIVASETSIAGFPAMVAGQASERPDVVLVHGAFATHVSWRPWLELFAAQGWRTIAASFSGRMGVGPERAKGRTIADYVEDTLQIIRTCGRPPILVGHSLGGLIVQKLAEMNMASAAVLLAPAPPFMLPAQAAAVPALMPMIPRIMIGAPILPTAWGCRRIVLNKMPADVCPIIHGQLVYESGIVYREMIFGSFKVDHTKVRCPVYVVAAEEDRIVSPQLARKVAALYGAEFRLYEDHAHWFLAEEGWEKIARDTSSWLLSRASR